MCVRTGRERSAREKVSNFRIEARECKVDGTKVFVTRSKNCVSEFQNCHSQIRDRDPRFQVSSTFAKTEVQFLRIIYIYVYIFQRLRGIVEIKYLV